MNTTSRQSRLGDAAQAFAFLLQLHDSQFPVGAFAQSGGLETYAQEGMDHEELEQYLRVQLAFGWGNLDLAAWVLAWRTPEDEPLLELHEAVSAWKVVPALRRSSVKLGGRTARLAVRLWPSLADRLPTLAVHQAVVSGAIARHLGVPGEHGLLAFAHATLASSLAAATRCLSLSPEQAQEVLVALTPALVEAVDRAWSHPEERFWAATLGADAAAFHQQHLDTRLFQS